MALQSPPKISGYDTDMPVNICSKQTNILKQGSVAMTMHSNKQEINKKLWELSRALSR